MESSICQFDRELQLLHREKLRLYPQLKLADLRQLTLYQELRLLQEFEGREEKLQEKLSLCIKEENSITSKLNASLRELEMKQAEVTKVQDRERSLAEAFQETVVDNPFEEFLTKVFKKMVKRDKKKEREGGGELFENTLHLRELRLDLEELVAEKKKNAEALKKMCDTVVKKEKVVKHNRKAAEDSLDLVYREKQQRMNELDVVVPLRLSQIVFDADRPLTSDLGQALLLNMTELKRLQRRTKELQEEIKEHKALHRQARHQHIKLIKDQREMDTQTQGKTCSLGKR
ncbi:unnamed protein product [Tetraodon nigroviridis]|uniref:(spotted green pufferfish) hypothetical protein n=1 Tax=Tetraodon nigroviridis TaxID=99883 RepID=Q4SEG6_TETNG|nr:unnamed protein product [Tetraodon nigroviridis]